MTHAVLVHGIWQNEGRCFGLLRKDLEKRGVTCLVPSLKPADGREGIATLAFQLRKEIDGTFGPDQHFVLIAFSMGGLVSRLYLQDLGGAARCDTLITISTPHHGTEMAKFHYGQGAAEMRPNSVFLHELRLGETILGEMPIISYRTPFDAVIVPCESSLWDRAENIEIPCPLHPMMTRSRKLRRDILRRFSYPG
jgi:triacylglycerol lipase